MENSGKKEKEHTLTMTFASQGFVPLGAFFGPGEGLLEYLELTHKWIPPSLSILDKHFIFLEPHLLSYLAKDSKHQLPTQRSRPSLCLSLTLPMYHRLAFTKLW